MNIQTYRLNDTGWIGVFLFILPTPISALYLYWILSPGSAPSMLVLTILATIGLIGFVMVIVGRDLVSFRQG